MTIQAISNFHIMQASGANELIKFNKSKTLYFDCWPPMNFFSNSVMLFKNIYDQENKKISFIKYLEKYLNTCKNFKNEEIDLQKTKKIFLDYFSAEKYKIVDNNKTQLLTSIDEFIDFISGKKIINNDHLKTNQFYKKLLLENNCLLSEGNFVSEKD